MLLLRKRRNTVTFALPRQIDGHIKNWHPLPLNTSAFPVSSQVCAVSGVLNLGTLSSWARLFFVVGSDQVHCRLFSNVLTQLDGNSTVLLLLHPPRPPPQLVTTKMSPGIVKTPFEAKLTLFENWIKCVSLMKSYKDNLTFSQLFFPT